MNLATNYLGLTLSSPFVVGASPYSDDLEMARRLEEAGASALVMRSLFAEQIAPRRSNAPTRANGKTADMFDAADYQRSTEAYLRQLERLKKAVSIPIIASLNGQSPGRWAEFARQLERAGANAIELNFYRIVTDPAVAADDVETEMLEMAGSVSGAVQIPFAAKLSPFHTSVAQLAIALELTGAAGIVLFNRFYQPDVNTVELGVQPILRLSDPGELLLRLRWLAILSPLLRGSLSASGGIHSASGVVKAILTGAHTVQLVSVLLKHGPPVIGKLRQGLERWMRDHNYPSLEQFRGKLNLQQCPDSGAYERASYIRVLQTWKA